MLKFNVLKALSLLILSALGFSAQAQATVGQFHVDMTEMSVTEVYAWNNTTGAYQQTNEKLYSRHTQWGDGEIKSEKLTSVFEQDIGENPEANLKLFRQGQHFELQEYRLEVNGQTGRAEPRIRRRALRLVEGSWKDFEAGRTVKAEIVDSANSTVDQKDATETLSMFSSLAEDYFQLIYRPLIENYGLSASMTPKIQAQNPKVTKLLLNKNQVAVRYEVEKVSVEAEIFRVLAPPPVLPPTDIQVAPPTQSLVKN